MVVNKSMKTAILKLTRLGLSEYEAKAYVSLLRESPLTAYEIAKKSTVPSSKIYEVIKRLETRHMVQSIHAERTRMFIPTPPEEFIERFRAVVEDNLKAVKYELGSFRSGIDTSYTWHIKDYDNLILRVKRMLDTSKEVVLLSVWPEEIEVLTGPLREAESRGVKIAIIHYGATNIRIGQVYRHPVEDTTFALKKVRGFSLVVDSKEALTGKIDGHEPEAVWSMNEGFVMMAEDHIKHDIYVMKIVSRFDPLLKKRFGFRYEGLRNVFRDEDIS